MTVGDFAALAPPHPFRRHQREALEALAAARDAGRRRAWVVLPPGAGKTLIGLETIRREGRRAVVLCPNTAIQGQWVRGWRDLRTDHGPNPVPVGSGRDLATPVTALTYQSLAVFTERAEGPEEPDDSEGPEHPEDPADPEHPADSDDPADPDEPEEPRLSGDAGGPEQGSLAGSELRRLHPNGLALVRTLQSAGPVTVVLDECHHLLEVWGRLLGEVLALLPEAVVLGLTATPATTLTSDQAALVGQLFGEPVYTASIPAVVREGHLAPFADLIWLTTPTAEEGEWLAEQSVRFAELTTQLLDPEFGSVPFLTWVDRRFAGEVRFDRLARKHPLLADAAVRLAHAGLVELDADVPAEEQHRHPPTADDWALLIGDWYDACLTHSADDRDEHVREALRRALPAVGYQLTRRGIRRGRSVVDRVLARSGSKSRAMVDIVAAEHRTLGHRMAMLVICDHEAATATVPVDLRGVLTERAGSARLALASLLADPATAALAPLMVTGRTVAAAPEVLERLRQHTEVELTVGTADGDGVAELSSSPRATGAWTSREWVRAATDFFSAGESKVLIGTRALLGEGWDAPTATGLVDLSMAGTPATVVQTRGRTLRRDPDDPAKVAVNWTVCCVTENHPKGDNDWQRTVTKHRGYFGVDLSGDVVDGVAHIHPAFSPYEPPPPETFDARNAEMLQRAERRAEIAEAWRVGFPYDDEIRLSVWVRSRRGDLGGDLEERRALDAPPELVLTAEGVTRQRDDASPVPLWLRWLLTAAAGRNRSVLAAVGRAPDPVQLAHALADGLRRAGLTSCGAEAVEWHLAADGRVRIVLDSGAHDERESRLFAEALSELLAPIAEPRYLVPRYLVGEPEPLDLLRPLSAYRPKGVVWHPVPSVLGRRAELAQAFASGWQTWVGGGPAVYTGGPEGAGALAASRGTDPMHATSVLRLSWR